MKRRVPSQAVVFKENKPGQPLEMKFERNRDVKDALEIGIAKKLPVWMKNTVWDYKNYYDVWNWATEYSKDFMFPYIVDRRGKKWYSGETIIINMEDNNSLLWSSVSSMCLPAVEAILDIPEKIFEDETLTMDVGTSQLKGFYYRGTAKSFYRGTNFGAYVQLAMTLGKGDFRVKDALTTYYKKYTKDEVREISES